MPQFHLYRLVLLVVSVGLTNLPAELFGQKSDPSRLLFLGPNRPVILEMEFVAGRFSIDEMRSQYAKEVFKQLDKDSNGTLSPEEAEQIPTEGRLRVGVERLGEAWTSIDVSPADQQVTLAELTAHIQKALGPPLSIERAPPKLAATVRLYEDLDLNKDGKVSAEEVEQGLKVLQAFDFDDDETLSVAELQPFPISVVQAQQQEQAKEEPVPLFFIRDDAEIELAISGLFDHYSTEEAVSAKILSGLKERDFSRFDLNDDRAWDKDDWELYLKRSRPDFVMKVSLSPPSVEVVKGEYTGRNRPTIDIGGMPVEWRATSKVYQQFDSTRLFLTRFIMSDVDKNKYLDPMEFNGLQADVPFEAVDLDGNQQVTREEIKFFFTMDGLAAQSRLILLLSNETKTLFEILDTNLDRRLNPREFLAGPERLLEYDLNGDQALLPDELMSEFRVTFTQPQLFEIDPARAQTNMMNQRQGRTNEQVSGPVWFSRMDDNLDGEISWREFLGPREMFDTLDTNSDHFIDQSEAEAAEALRTDSGN
ncbi:EF-hand domain-containing protein [Thalassoglobus polymorphus]|uniref:Transaldolase/EF-hand domain-containing protein n=1 Tax=Thalassoglobus polymorphus TaxID=2527994 RepID=A0A517QQ33_9PLAN|nr:hypothetical protein [Thalassoglobus polymorphus]QDT33749.1 transaldolase/EF-hand domain-containing protein [Thalassoglobus polymorphus]